MPSLRGNRKFAKLGVLKEQECLAGHVIHFVRSVRSWRILCLLHRKIPRVARGGLVTRDYSIPRCYIE